MKNIGLEEIKQYNTNFENKDVLEKYMQVNIIHLEEDMKKNEKYLARYNMLGTLLRECSEIHLRILHREVLEERHIKIFEDINNYNTAKNKEIKVIGVLTVVFLIVSIFTTFFL